MEKLLHRNEQLKKDNMQVSFIDLKRQYFLHKEEILSAIDKVLSSGSYILGEMVETFEKKIAEYLGCRFALGVANGTDALILAFKSAGIGHTDEVILPTNSFLATAGAVIAVGAKPLLCDVKQDLNIDVDAAESLITKNTKAIIPVHLTGRPAEMDKIETLAKRHSLMVIEDAAQSIGARYKNQMTGSIGDVGCFSLHPLKNLRVYGDGGLVATNNEELYATMKLLRNHGLVNRDTCLRFGLNSRLDSIQAGIALAELPHLEKWNHHRRYMAGIYRERLKDVLEVPIDKTDEHAVYHNFVVLTDQRDSLMKFLLNKGVETKIHYPVPIHLQPAAASLGHKLGDFPVAEKLAMQMLSLPIYAELREDELNYTVDAILEFFKR